MDLNSRELELMAKNTGSAITALIRKKERTGQDDGIDEQRRLLGRVLEEQLTQGRATA